MNTKQRNDVRGRGFTRTDLLAVLVITVLLLTLHLPLLGGTKSGSQAAVCAANLRKLVQAWTMYADDHSGRLTPNRGSVFDRQTWVTGWLDFSSRFDNINVSYLVGFEQTGRYGLLGPYLQRDASVFKCPADRSMVMIFGRSRARVRSVSMNNWMGGSAYNQEYPYRVFEELGDVSRPEPATALVTIEEREDSINDSVFSVSMTGPALIDYPASFHDGGANLTFADGHVEFRMWVDPRTVPTLHRGESLPINVPSLDNPDFIYLRGVATSLK
jgi:prepilin-type processing-associated H-X9-DG protein